VHRWLCEPIIAVGVRASTRELIDMREYSGEAGSTAGGPGVLVADLAVELYGYLVALPRDPYRKQLREMVAELVEFHRADLDDSVVALVGETLTVIDPTVATSSATLVDLETRWQAALDGLPGRTYNALSLCRVLSDVREDLEDARPWMGRSLVYAIVGDDIRPQTPREFVLTWPGERVPKVADEAAPEIRMLRRFIASALQAIDEAGVPRPSAPEWVTARRGQ
jgi:hypothetical protein